MEDAIAQNKPIHVLLADDDVDEQYLFEAAIKELPIVTNVKTVSDGIGLIAYLFQNPDSQPDVIFLDIMMPRKDGIECLKEIKSNEKLRQIPIIMYSNTVGAHYIMQCYQYGASYFLPKGNYSELAESISKLLAITGKYLTQGPIDKFTFSLGE